MSLGDKAVAILPPAAADQPTSLNISANRFGSLQLSQSTYRWDLFELLPS